MFYSSKGKEAFRVSDNTSGVAGVIGSLQYFSNAENPTADFSLEAGTHKIPVIKLLHEFTALVNDKKYVEEVLAESLVVEAKTRTLSTAELKEVNDKLNAGDSVRSIALSLDVPYRQISRIKKGVSVKPVDPPAVAKNDSTLNDKVKYLEETMEDIYQISRRVGAGAFNSLFISGRAGTGKTYNVERALKDEGLIEDQDYVLVSGAAGAVGSIVGQIAKIKGCTVIGIAGGKEKCDYVVNKLDFDAAIDYKSENVTAGIKQNCPKGIDVYFDNVGGEILDAALIFLRKNARVVICGAISQYNATTAVAGPKNYLSLLVNRASMKGMVVLDYAQDYGKAMKEMAGWMQEGKLKSREDVYEGIENFRETFLRLFSGEKNGKLVLKVN